MVREGRSKEYDVKCGVVEYMRNRPDTDGITLDEGKFIRSLDEYYRLRGWDVAAGWPAREKLDELDLNDIADELDRTELLP
jgi:aldehyde:ferredoxin oxidoreductase